MLGPDSGVAETGHEQVGLSLDWQCKEVGMSRAWAVHAGIEASLLVKLEIKLAMMRARGGRLMAGWHLGVGCVDGG